MKIQSFKRLVKENVQEDYRDLIDAVGTSINPFADEVINALNKNISVDDNLLMQHKDIELSVKADGTPVNLTQFKSILRSRVKGIVVTRVENLSNTSTYPTGAPFVTFSENNQVITIAHITGLSVNTKYRVTLLSIG